MKIYNIILSLTALIVLASCGNDFVVGDFYDLEELPGYVAFDADGNTISIDPFDGDEGGSIDVVIENPTGTDSDITVNYSLGGTAVYGEDYTIEGATASGGSLVIDVDNQVFNETFRAPLPITFIDNDDFDGDPRTILITLTSASNAEGDLAVGRGGTDLLKEATVNIIDDECDSQYEGSYNVSTTVDSLVIDGVLDTITLDPFTSTATVAKDGGFFSYNVDDASGGLYASEFIGGTSLPLLFTEDCGALSMSEQTDFDGQGITLLSGGVSADGVITMVLKRDGTGEQFTSVFTPQ